MPKTSRIFFQSALASFNSDEVAAYIMNWFQEQLAVKDGNDRQEVEGPDQVVSIERFPFSAIEQEEEQLK
jgi:hypothetical protein